MNEMGCERKLRPGLQAAAGGFANVGNGKRDLQRNPSRAIKFVSSLSLWDAARDKSSCNNAVQPDEVIHRHAHNAAHLLCNNTI